MKIIRIFLQTEANLASKCNLTKIFNLSYIFALPNTLLKPKNYCTPMPKRFWNLTIFVKWEVFNWILNLNYIFKWNRGSSCDIRHTHTNTQRKKKEGSFHFLFSSASAWGTIKRKLLALVVIGCRFRFFRNVEKNLSHCLGYRVMERCPYKLFNPNRYSERKEAVLELVCLLHFNIGLQKTFRTIVVRC